MIRATIGGRPILSLLTVGALSEIRLHLARVPWRSVDFLFFYVVVDVFLYIFIDFAGLEGLVIYWAVLLTGF